MLLLDISAGLLTYVNNPAVHHFFLGQNGPSPGLYLEKTPTNQSSSLLLSTMETNNNRYAINYLVLYYNVLNTLI